MPLDDTWWDPAGPFGDNAEGLITAEVMRDFAKAIADDAVTGSWISLLFDPQAITSIEWSTAGVSKVLWLKKTPAFTHSQEWTYATDPEGRDTYTYEPIGDITLQVTFAPSIIHVTGAISGTIMTPVACLSAAPAPPFWEEPDDDNTFVVGPSLTIADDDVELDIGGWATVLRATTERNVRIGLRFTPDPSADPPVGVVPGGDTFAVDATGAGATVVARPLAPSA